MTLSHLCIAVLVRSRVYSSLYLNDVGCRLFYLVMTGHTIVLPRGYVLGKQSRPNVRFNCLTCDLAACTSSLQLMAFPSALLAGSCLVRCSRCL